VPEKLRKINNYGGKEGVTTMAKLKGTRCNKATFEEKKKKGEQVVPQPKGQADHVERPVGKRGKGGGPRMTHRVGGTKRTGRLDTFQYNKLKTTSCRRYLPGGNEIIWFLHG